MKKILFAIVSIAVATLFIACSGSAKKDKQAESVVKSSVQEKIETNTKGWPDNELTEGLPKPAGIIGNATTGDVKVGKSVYYATRISIEWTKEETKAYYEALKKAGFKKSEYAPEPDFDKDSFTATLSKGEIDAVLMKNGIILQKKKEETGSETKSNDTNAVAKGWEKNEITKELPEMKKGIITDTKLTKFREKDGSRTIDCHISGKWSLAEAKEYYEALKKAGFNVEKEPDFKDESYFITLIKGNTTIWFSEGLIAINKKEK